MNKSHNTIVPPYLQGQDPYWMPETVDSTDPHVYYAFPYAYTPMTEFNL